MKVKSVLIVRQSGQGHSIGLTGNCNHVHSYLDHILTSEELSDLISGKVEEIVFSSDDNRFESIYNLFESLVME